MKIMTSIYRMPLFLTGLLAIAAIGNTIPALAQDTNGTDATNKRVTLNLENADLRYALKLLFSSAGMNYTLDQAVQGAVTVSLNDVPFRTALESVLRSTQSSTPLTYRVEDRVYVISPKIENIEPPTTVEGPVL